MGMGCQLNPLHRGGERPVAPITGGLSPGLTTAKRCTASPVPVSSLHGTRAPKKWAPRGPQKRGPIGRAQILFSMAAERNETKLTPMPLAGNNRDARARAHYKWAERYAGTGEAGRARAHFGRALEYTRFGGNEELLQNMPGNIRKRFMAEIKRIGEVDGADDVTLAAGDKALLMSFTSKTDGSKIVARIPDGYPIVKTRPDVYVNGRKAQEDWAINDNIIDVVNRYRERSAKKTVLILCHPRLVASIKDEANGHWLGKLPANEGKEETIYDSIMSMHAHGFKSDQPVSFFTVDNQPDSNKADYKADAFDPSFVNEHTGEYDAIFVPDCGGSWAEATGRTQQGPAEPLVGQCVAMMSMLKPGGFVFFSKMSADLRELLRVALGKAGHHNLTNHEISIIGGPVLVATL